MGKSIRSLFVPEPTIKTGGGMLRQFKAVLGEERFFAAVSAYAKQFAFAEGSSVKLLQALEKVSNSFNQNNSSIKQSIDHHSINHVDDHDAFRFLKRRLRHS